MFTQRWRHAVVVAVASMVTSATAAAPPSPDASGGNGTLYLASYAKRLTVIDEASERVAAEIPLKNGLAWTMRLSADRTRFYVQSADSEQFEVIDVAARQSIDSFTLNDEHGKHVRTMAYDVDPANRYLVAVARTAIKLSDRFEIGPPVFIQYDLKEHKVLRTAPWTHETEPRQYQVRLRFSPDGRLLYVFADEILIYDSASLKQVDSWDLSLPRDVGTGRVRLRSTDETVDEPGFFSALFTIDDPVQHRRLLGVGRVDLAARSIDFFPIGPTPDRGELTFAMAPDRRRAYVLHEQIRRYELWTVDLAAKRVQSRIEFDGRPRMALRTSSNGKLLYIFEAGNTIDLYQANGFKYLRTIPLDADMMYDTFHVVPARSAAGRSSSER
jgi:hypothetical protein